MNVNIVTKEDLLEFKKELVAELTAIVSARPPMPVKWLKSYQVIEMLNISRGTLQNLRINGTIEFTKIQGLTFYNYDDIVKMMEKDKKNVKPQLKRH